MRISFVLDQKLGNVKRVSIQEQIRQAGLFLLCHCHSELLVVDQFELAHGDAHRTQYRIEISLELLRLAPRCLESSLIYRVERRLRIILGLSLDKVDGEIELQVHILVDGFLCCNLLLENQSRRQKVGLLAASHRVCNQKRLGLRKLALAQSSHIRLQQKTFIADERLHVIFTVFFLLRNIDLVPEQIHPKWIDRCREVRLFGRVCRLCNELSSVDLRRPHPPVLVWVNKLYVFDGSVDVVLVDQLLDRHLALVEEVRRQQTST